MAQKKDNRLIGNAKIIEEALTKNLSQILMNYKKNLSNIIGTRYRLKFNAIILKALSTKKAKNNL